MEMNTVASGDECGTPEKPFRPIVFLLNSHTPENVDALTVSNLLKPRFRKDDYYVVDISHSSELVSVPSESKKSAMSDATSQSGASALPNRMSAAVQSALSRIATARQEAAQAAAAARAAELSALQADYLEDGLSTEEALAAASAELQERYDAEYDDGAALDEDGSDSNYGGPLPPCVCIVGVPLLPAVVSRLARDVTGVAAVVLLESPCSVRELAAAPGSSVKTNPVTVGGPHAPGDRVRGRGGAGPASTGSSSMGANKQQGLFLKSGASAEELLSAFRAAALTQPRETSFQDVLLQHVVYPTEGVNGPSASSHAPTVPRPAVPAAQFLSDLVASLLRIFSSWVRYNAWRARRSLVQVPLYTPLIDSEAALTAATVKEAAATSPEADKRSTKRRGGSPESSTRHDNNSSPATVLELPTTTPNPRTMSQVAAENFEYSAYMQRWAGGLPDKGIHKTLAAGVAIQVCLRGCLYQVASSQGTSTLRTLAETSAAQLSEDVASATSKCRTAVAVTSGAPSQPENGGAAEEDTNAGAADCSPTVVPASTKGALIASSVEEALALTVAAEAGSNVLSNVSAAIVTAVGSGDAVPWMRDVLLARDQQGWQVAAQEWEETVLYCLHQPPVPLGTLRTEHAVYLLDSHTTFPRFFHEEGFLEEEGRHYSPSSLGDDTEEDEDSESESDSSSVDSLSDSSHDGSVGTADDVTAKAVSAISHVPTPVISKVDHIDIVNEHLRRRRVLEQVRLSHSRLPVQEFLDCAAPCRNVVTETQWMRAADGTVVEVSRTAANSAQVRCTVIDALSELQAGFMLECPSSAVDTSAEATGTDPKRSETLPQPIVPSAVRGFLSVGRNLNVMTEVIADNTQAAARAAHTAAVAAAKEAALVQYEAQFRSPGKPSKPRDKAAAASMLTLEQITETLLAAVPPAPPSPSSEESDGRSTPVPRVMRVYACFFPHNCVMTAATSKSGVPGVQLRCLPPSQHTRHLTGRELLTVHVWGEGVLSATSVKHLQAIRVYLDGVVEVQSPDLARGVRLLLCKDGSYITICGKSQLLVSPDGRMTLYESGGGARVVRQLQHGYWVLLTQPTLRYVEREDGVQLEIVETSDAGKINRPGLTPSKLGCVHCIRFGSGVKVEQGSKDGMWLWRFDGIPTVYCDAAEYEIAVAVDDDESYRLAYQPRSSSFSLFVMDGETEDFQVAANVSMCSCRISLFTQGFDLTAPSSEQRSCSGVFAVDCAYGGAYGRVGTNHVYRVSPFGRCCEGIEQSGEPRRHQLVLPRQYKRPKKTIAEAVLLPEYASPLFHSTVAGEEGTSKIVEGGEDTDPLHLQLSPLLPPEEPPRISTRTAAFPHRALTVQHPGASAPPRVRCVALRGDGAQFAVLDAVSWQEWVLWWQRHGSWIPHCSSRAPTEHQQAGEPEVYDFRIMRAPPREQRFMHVPEDGGDKPLEEAPMVQGSVLLQPPCEDPSIPSWCTPGTLVALIDAKRTDSADKDEETTATQVEIGEVEEPLNSASVCPTEPEGSPEVEIARPTSTSCVPARLAVPGRRGGSLNYWSSLLSPQALGMGVDDSSTGNGDAMTPTRVKTASPLPDVATTDAVAPLLPKAPLAGSKIISSYPGRVPLMHSYHSAADELTGTAASSRYHSPALEVQPTQVEFGNVLPGRRYMATVKLTNISTVPCRYRVRVGAAVRPYVSTSYSRQFVAPGLTTEMHIELSGTQPYGVKDSEITVSHEGGAVAVAVWWCTTDETHTTKLGDGIICLGWTVHKPAIQHPSIPADNTDQVDENNSFSDSDVTEDIRVA
ncbi:hypothetical protein JKF63_07070 [Porcisia hertigi]|uniref:Uncharacterized protein n=1 Tax=Porcisia hertigi TaxID=2761500 RepID=A0A836LJ17_9TRYP|nr:hypothetical protein JKF63_07070 [Porcisia hertigi]